MKLAGRFLSLAQGAAEGALLAPLRFKYRMQFNLEELANAAKQRIQEDGLRLTPSTLLNVADDIASQQTTMLEDIVGTTQERWNDATKSLEDYIVPDPRQYFIR